ncbi:sensor histidine kinase [Magnetospirillum moscoviense]|uniref:histidine kinase n=1 Tax=Magnetospirillum moscoviense TaxID=1437059 RepID=A0A178MP52_9PROT|nr:ATP-binding protein [Magnetospirillum moscoviense]OAN49908.1 hypothetical protein A6A05_12850 [Magnetospirillum moscoviense]
MNFQSFGFGWVGTGRRHVLPWVAACLVCLLCGAALLHVDSVERQRWREAERLRSMVQLDTIRSRLEAGLYDPLLRIRGMAAQIIARGDITQAEFDRAAEYLLRGHRNVRNMVVSRGMVIAMTYPLAGNESVIGVDYRSIPAQYALVVKAMETRKAIMQGPIPLIQGGTGLIARLPVFVDGDTRFFGMVNIILDVPSTLADAGLQSDDLPIEVAIRGRDGLGAAGAVFHGREGLFAQSPVEADVRLPYGSWRLAAIPKGGWDKNDPALVRSRFMLAGMFVLVVLFSFATARYIIDREIRSRALGLKTRELERSNADLERFAYVASHDLQTPLRTIGSFAQLLERRYRGRLDSEADEFLSFITDGAHRVSQMVVDLLNYARVEGAGRELVPVPTAELLAEIMSYTRTDMDLIGATISVGPLPTVMGDRTQLVSLFQNLIDNAVKYRDLTRPLEITVSARPAADGTWEFCVADNGIGIDPQYSEKIFEFFQRLHPPGTGSGAGVGLALCRRIVHRLGGDIRVESSLGQGARFLFTLLDPAEAARRAG